MAFERIVFDLEATNLLEPMIDFMTRPLKLKEEAKLWCVSVRCLDTDQDYMLIPQNILEELSQGLYNNPEHDEEFSKIKLLPLNKEMLGRIFAKAELIAGHNIVKYDLPVLQLFGLIDYQIGYPYYEVLDNEYKTESLINGKSVQIIDTLVLSKLLNPDRPSHALKAFGTENSQKLDFSEFSMFSKEMVIYARQDTVVSVQAYNQLTEEKGDYEGWDIPYLMELKLADLVLKQELFGFQYNTPLSKSNKVELDALLKERYDAVTPNIPPKPLNKTESKQWTPPATKITGTVSYNDKVKGILDSVGAIYKEDANTFVYKNKEYPLSYVKSIQDFVPPSKRKAKSGALTSAMKKFLDTLGSSYNPISDSYTYEGREYSLDYEGCVKEVLDLPEVSLSSHMEKFLEKVGATYNPDTQTYTFEGEEFPIDYSGCIKRELPASIKDLSHLKGYLMSLGWVPSQWNIRDLTRDSKKKLLSEEKFYETVERYLNDTFEGPFTQGRLKELDLPEDTTIYELRTFLTSEYNPQRPRPVKVSTTPPFRVGATKDLCPNLQKLSDEGTVSFVKDMVEYFTYQHRRNSIAGGIDEDTGEPTKGFESYVRTDGRISTPCDSVGTNTSRFKHMIVCNIPRVSSLYGYNMRDLFQAGNNQIQFGYDYSSFF